MSSARKRPRPKHAQTIDDLVTAAASPSAAPSPGFVAPLPVSKLHSVKKKVKEKLKRSPELAKKLIHAAAEKNDEKTLLEIIQTHANSIDVKGAQGNTPLLVALKSQSEYCVKILMAAGADVSIKNKAGISPYVYVVGLIGTANANVPLHAIIINSMIRKEDNLRLGWQNTKDNIAFEVDASGPVKARSNTTIPVYFEKRKAELVARADKLGTPIALAIKDDILSYNYLDPVVRKPVVKSREELPPRSFFKTRPNPFDVKVVKEEDILTKFIRELK